MTSPTIVLVHGALTDASVWRSVSADLQDHGVTVLAPALPMRSFDGDVAYLRSVLDTCEGPLVVVAHSYAGSVVSAPDALTTAVRALVFVAAFQQDSGETPGGLNGMFPGTQLVPENLLLQGYPGGTEVSLRPDRFADTYAADVDRREVAIMAAAQHPFDARTLEGSFSGTATWRRLPSWALVATADASIPTQAQRYMADRAGSTVAEVHSSHAVPVAHPDAVVAVVRSAVAAAAA